MANDPSRFEYTLKDTSVAAVTSSGARFDFSRRVNGHTVNPNGESSTGKGSGANPQYHTGVTYEPEFSITIPIDEADRFDEWVQANASASEEGLVCDVERKRSKPKVRTVTDLLVAWLPIRGEEAFAEGDATMVEYTGKFFEIRRDITGSITA
jgi:hypothetical protein